MLPIPVLEVCYLKRRFFPDIRVIYNSPLLARVLQKVAISNLHWTMLDSPPMRDPSNSATVCSASSVEQYDGREVMFAVPHTQGHGQHHCFLQYWRYLRCSLPIGIVASIHLPTREIMKAVLWLHAGTPLSPSKIKNSSCQFRSCSHQVSRRLIPILSEQHATTNPVSQISSKNLTTLCRLRSKPVCCQQYDGPKSSFHFRPNHLPMRLLDTKSLSWNFRVDVI